MNQLEIQQALRERAEAIERLRPDPGRLSAIVAASTGGRPTHPRWGPLIAGLACLVLGTAVASAATGLLDPALDSFFDGGDSPGRRLSANELPAWLHPRPGYNAPGEVSVVAAAGGERLYAYRQGSGICFDYGHHVGECRSPRAWRRHLERTRWILRGPLGRSVWFGLVGADIVSVRAVYASGKPAEVAVRHGAFVLDLQRARRPQRLIGLDASGGEVTSRALAAGSP